jgi:hypothetical protein
MNILHSYQNGNTRVCLYEDGTKERTFDGTPSPTHPESIDVKITNYCDAGCSFCHEKSTVKGLHGDLDVLLNVLLSLPAGVEIAIGGGNPLSHPGLIPFLRELRAKGIIPNITINQKHLKPYKDLILNLVKDELVFGVGISYSSPAYIEDIKPILEATDCVVFHVIMGINTVHDIDILSSLCAEYNRTCKVLVLGYKVFGFGLNYYLRNKRIEENKYQWYTTLATYFKKKGLILSFDNLAIKQMNLQRFFTEDAWAKFYMGDDFVFTMYIDGVEQKFAPSSTSEQRFPFSEIKLLDYFQNHRNKEVS